MRLRRVITVGATVAATTFGAAALPVDAATADQIDVTVAESLPVSTPGEVTDDGGLEDFGCLGAEVATSDVSASSGGSAITFAGTKVFHCDDGTLTLSFRTSTSACSTTDRGSWRVIDGTGDFEGASGGGQLIGTYTGGDGTYCDNDGIDDRYIGVIITR